MVDMLSRFYVDSSSRASRELGTEILLALGRDGKYTTLALHVVSLSLSDIIPRHVKRSHLFIIFSKHDSLYDQNENKKCTTSPW